MAQATFKHGNPTMVAYTAGGTVAVGAVVVTGGSPRIAHFAMSNGDVGTLAAFGGVYLMTGDAEIASDVGVYWDASTGKFSATDDSAANAFLGFLVSACSGDNGTALVRHAPQAVLDDGD